MNFASCIVASLAGAVALAGYGSSQKGGPVSASGGLTGISGGPIRGGGGTSPSIPPPASGSWQRTTNSVPSNIALGASLLLTDGTVIVQNYDSSVWYKLTPDNTGSYVNGTWTQIASMPSGYAPLYFASAVLANGKVVAIGGEYNGSGGGVWTNKGATYDPIANTWTTLAPPTGWNNVGDAECTVLPNGKFMLANSVARQQALLDPTTMKWTALSTNGKADSYDEEGWTLLPDGTILSPDAENSTHTERYYPTTDTWVSAGETPQILADPSSAELGPAVLRPDGTVFQMGATGHNAVWSPITQVWTAAPDFPIISGAQLDIADGPACLLPDGNVLSAASPGVFNTPVHFYEYDGTNLNLEPSTPNAPSDSSFYGNMIMLPTGQVLFTDFSNDAEIYTPSGSPQDAWRPTITTVPTYVAKGSTYTIAGTQFNGLSQCSAYGDDATNATNYPLVQIQNVATGHVFFCRTHDHSTMGVATGAATVSTHFDIPAGIETGPSTLFVVTNGIRSVGQPINVVGAGVVLPDSYTLFRGILSSGNNASLFFADSSFLNVLKGPTLTLSEPPIQVVTNGTTAVTAPNTVSITVIGKVSTPGLSQTISLYNYSTSSYVAVDTRSATTTSQTVTVTAPGTASQYVGPNGAVQALVSYAQTGPTLTFQWNASVDLVNWTIQ